MLADVRLAQPPPDLLSVNATEAGFALIAPFGDGWYRVIAWNWRRQRPASEPVGLAEIRDLTRQVLSRVSACVTRGDRPGSTTTLRHPRVLATPHVGGLTEVAFAAAATADR